MYARVIFPAYALGLLLLLIAACGGGGGDAVECDFGGPYRFGGPAPFAMTLREKQEKQADFQRYERLELSLSRALVLDDKVFEKSVKANRNASPQAMQQRYNYVITKDCGEILVAGWNENGDLDQIVGGIACLGGSDSFHPPTTPDNMIDWAPEEPYGSALVSKPKPTSQSPCWLDTKREDGILDAISKHFMLAQGEGSTIDQFKAKKWAKARVAYAGEILVDLKTCTYIVTEDSGTYRPFGKYRREVNKFFATVVNHQTGIPTLPNPVLNCLTPTPAPVTTPTSTTTPASTTTPTFTTTPAPTTTPTSTP